MKTSSKLIILLVVCLLSANITSVYYLIKKKKIINFFGKLDNLYKTDFPYKNYNHIYFKGSHWDNIIFVRHSTDWRIEVPKNDSIMNHINMSQKNDTLYISFTPSQFKSKFPSIYIYTPTLRSVYLSKGCCHIHDYKVDSLSVKAEDYGFLWIDADTLDYVSAEGRGECKIGLFNRNHIKHANFDFSGTTEFMSWDVSYESVEQKYTSAVKVDARGVSAKKVHK